MDIQEFEIIVPVENHLERIDSFIAGSIEVNFSRSHIQKLIKTGNIVVNGKEIKANYNVKTDDSIRINIPEPLVLDLKPENIDIDVVYEDSSLIVINKQPGLVIHPGPGNWDGTLVNALLYHIEDLSSIGGEVRPGIVHRLDKDTSGVMVIAKNDLAHQNLTGQFSSRTIDKRYRAIVKGKPVKEHDMIDLPIARHKKYRQKMTIAESGRESLTEYWIQKIWNSSMGTFTMLELKLHTGRTHQIRVHLSHTGNPVVGDQIYSKKWDKYKVPYLLLASTSLRFTHPETREEMKFEVDLPEHMVKFISRLDIMSQPGGSNN